MVDLILQSKTVIKKGIFILLLLVTTMHSAWAVTITARVDRSPVNVDETFNLIFEANESPDAQPDFTALEKDFEIISQNQSSNISIVNGKYSKNIKWNLVVIAKHAGKVTIPKISFGKDSSSALTVNITKSVQNKSNNNADFFMELEVQPDEAWVQSQIIVSLRFFSAYNLSRFSGFSELKTQGVDTIIENLGEDRQFQTKRGNRQYLVIERKFALFPQTPGTMTIPAMRAEAQLTNTARSMFDPFQSSGQIKRVRSGAKKITVIAKPDTYTGKSWLPAKELNLSEKWPENVSAFKAGEPITRTITLVAKGLTAEQLPEIESSKINGIKQYPDKAELHNLNKESGIIGLRQEKIAYIPTHAGNFTLPAIEVNWWNTETGQQETANIPAKQIQVSKSDIKQNQPVLENTITDQTPKKTENVLPPPSAQNKNSLIELSIILFLAGGWLITLIAWWRSTKHKKTAKETTTQKSLSHTKAKQKLKKACQNNDAQQCKSALLTWGQIHFPDGTVKNLGQLAKQLNEPLKVKLNELDEALYSPHDTKWQAGELYSLICDWEKNRTVKKGSGKQTLEPFRKE